MKERLNEKNVPFIPHHDNPPNLPQKAKELDQKMLQAMVEGVRKKLRAMWRDGLYSVC